MITDFLDFLAVWFLTGLVCAMLFWVFVGSKEKDYGGD